MFSNSLLTLVVTLAPACYSKWPRVYTNGESTVEVEKRWIYPTAQWPIKVDGYAFLIDMEHSAWAMHDGSSHCDLLHVHAAPA